MEEDEKPWNLTRLVEAITNGITEIKPTLTFYCRVAHLVCPFCKSHIFITNSCKRWQFNKQKNLPEASWWVNGADLLLKECRVRGEEATNR